MDNSHRLSFTYLSQEDLIESGCFDIRLAILARLGGRVVDFEGVESGHPVEGRRGDRAEVASTFDVQRERHRIADLGLRGGQLGGEIELPHGADVRVGPALFGHILDNHFHGLGHGVDLAPLHEGEDLPSQRVALVGEDREAFAVAEDDVDARVPAPRYARPAPCLAVDRERYGLEDDLRRRDQHALRHSGG